MTAHYQCVGTIDNSTNLLGTLRTQYFDNIGLNFNTNSSFTLPAGIVGNFVINMVVLGSLSAVTAPVTAYSGGTSLLIYSGGPQYSNSGTTSISLFLLEAFSVNDINTPVTVTYTVGTYPTSPVSIDLYVMEVNTGLVK